MTAVGAQRSHEFDAIVLGGGSPGEHCAAALADGGLRVAIVERELLGGECSYWACIPSKTLLRAGEALAAARDVPGAREAISGPVDPAAVLAWRDFQVSGYDDAGQQAWASSKGIEVLRGEGRLSGPHAVTVASRTYTATHVVIATGSDPFVPAIPGLRELTGVWTSRDATGLKEVPRHLLVLGAGPVGVEMAQAIARLGAAVTLVGAEDHILGQEPGPLGEAVAEALVADGIELCLGRRARGARRDGEDYVLEFPDGMELRGDRLLLSTGRRPRVDGIGLETVGVPASPQGLPVDARLSIGDNLWAVGDVTGVWPLTYVGKYQARVVAANILGHSRDADYTAVPRVVFTDPQAAAVGESEGPYKATVALAAVARTATYSRAYDTKPGFLTLVSDGERLTGAYAVGPEAGEWLQQATVAIRARVPMPVLFDVIQPFPTFAEAFLPALRNLEAQMTRPSASALDGRDRQLEGSRS